MCGEKMEHSQVKTRDRSLGDGVYFAETDYIGFNPRISDRNTIGAIVTVAVDRIGLILLTSVLADVKPVFMTRLGYALKQRVNLPTSE